MIFLGTITKNISFGLPHRPWNERQHPRVPKGMPQAGEWAIKGRALWQYITESARHRVIKAHKEYSERSTQLRDDLANAVDEAAKYKDLKDWYIRHKALAKDLFRSLEPTFEKFLAAASAGTAGKQNVNEALRAMKHYMMGGVFDDGSYVPKTLYIQGTLMNYDRIQKDQPLSGDKVSHFYQNLMGNMREVTADRHIGRLLFKNFKGDLSKGQHAVATGVISAVARKLNWQPAELQAALWAVAKAQHANGLPADLWDYQMFLLEQEAKIRALVDYEKV